MYTRKKISGQTIFLLCLLAITLGASSALGAESREAGKAATDKKAEDLRGPEQKARMVKEAICRERERVKRRIEMIRMWGLVSELNLDPETAKEFFPVVNRFRHKRTSLARKVHQVKMQLAVALSKKDVPDDQVRKLIEKFYSILAMQSRLWQEEFRSLSKILNPRQQAQYILFGDRFNRELQVIIRQVMKENSRRNLNPGQTKKVAAPSP